MSTIKSTKLLNTEDKIRDLILRLQIANAQVQDQPLEACTLFTQIITQADALADEIPETALSVLQNIQETAGDNLVQAALMATAPNELDAVVPVLSGKMTRLHNILNLGFYLQEHQISLIIDGQDYSAAYCCALAKKMAPDHDVTLRLTTLVE
jgi:hypothetical protein